MVNFLLPPGIYMAAASYFIFHSTPKMVAEFAAIDNELGTVKVARWQQWGAAIVGAVALLVALVTLSNPTDVYLFSMLLAPSLALALVDLKTRYLPDRLQLICLILSFALCAFEATERGVTAVLTGRLFALTLPALLWTLAWLYERFRKREGLGFGDVKLLGWMALLLDSEVFTALFFALGISLALQVPMMVMRKADRYTVFPFGPALIAGFIVSYIIRHFQLQ